jgi:hypothetical protein
MTLTRTRALADRWCGGPASLCAGVRPALSPLESACIVVPIPFVAVPGPFNSVAPTSMPVATIAVVVTAHTASVPSSATANVTLGYRASFMVTNSEPPVSAIDDQVARRLLML